VLNIHIDGAQQIAATFASMLQQVEKLGKEQIAAELTEWQTQDMHRKIPNTKQEDDVTVTTEIWPRSRVTMARDLLRKKRHTVVQVTPRSAGAAAHHRPILRSELFDMLCVRMAALMNRVLRWQVKA
jgi:hypothetical protein